MILTPKAAIIGLIAASATSVCAFTLAALHSEALRSIPRELTSLQGHNLLAIDPNEFLRAFPDAECDDLRIEIACYLGMSTKEPIYKMGRLYVLHAKCIMPSEYSHFNSCQLSIFDRNIDHITTLLEKHAPQLRRSLTGPKYTDEKCLADNSLDGGTEMYRGENGVLVIVKCKRDLSGFITEYNFFSP